MKKSYNQMDITQKQGQEQSKKLYRSISDQAKRLDDARSCARNIGDLFTPNLVIQRKKFCEYCERLIFSETVLYGKKLEEFLWRKGYYDVISTTKKLKKKEYTQDEVSLIQSHINSGIGFYHHLLSKLQYEFDVDVTNFIDFAMLHDDTNEENAKKKESVQWSKEAIYQCLVYLGDLNRYKLEIYPNWEPTLAVRYYLQAISYRPECGMPHNQMGMLSMNQNHFLDSVYHYMRCLACKIPFEGTTNNLLTIFEKNSQFIEQIPKDENADCIIEPSKSENIKRFLSRFLLLIDIWYFKKKVDKVYSLCHQICKNFEECLGYTKPPTSESDKSPTDTESTDNDSLPSYLSGQTVFKIIVICLLCISKLKTTNSPQLSAAVAFTLAIYSQLLQTVTNHIQESVLNYPLNENYIGRKVVGILKELMNIKKRSKSKLRRRNVLKNESEEESDASDNDGDGYYSSDDSFLGDEEDVLAASSDEESDIIKVSDESICDTLKQQRLPNGIANGHKPDSIIPTKTKDDIVRKVQHMDVNDMLEIVMEEGTLQSIKIINNWLQYDQEVVKSCGANTRSLMKQITYLLNLINVNLNSPNLIGVNLKLSEVIHKENQIPLSEDVVLKGLEILENSQSHMNWHFNFKRGLSPREESVVRIIKLISFGKWLTTIEDTGVTYDGDNNCFACSALNDEGENVNKTPTILLEEMDTQQSGRFGKNSPVEPSTEIRDTNTISTNGNQQLNKMKHMGQLWLAAEVRALENRVGSKAALSPYLVLDSDALIKYTYMVKSLVNSRKFIVLVPTAVVSALDDLKRERMEARDAIRWLESQFHRGNRFFRAQRPQERATIPFIKYPKKKDKEMHIYIQIIECCYFLAEQQNGASNVVTLLIGNNNVLSNGENKEFSYVGLAKSVGISIESITTFYGKWKTNKGKR